MKTKTTKAVDQNDLLDIEKVATEMAAMAVAPASLINESSAPEAKTAKVPKKKVVKATAEEAPVTDSAIETVVEGVADKVIVVADEPITPATSEATPQVPAAEQPAATTEPAPKVAPNQILFSSLGISDEMLQAVTDMGFTSPSPIQAEAIPPILAGRDVIGQAQTGTGKTAAFGIPALELVDVQDRSVQALILCPTRELALQVADEIRKLAKHKRGIRIEAIYGGDSIDRQIRSLKSGVHIVIGTPGRVMDHMERNTLKLGNVKMMILDEADEMLDMGFREDIESILEDMPQERQTILFSATMSKPILQITQKFLQDPVLVKVVKKELTATNIEQVYFEVKPKGKVEVMCRLIDMYDLKLLLVFCNTKRKVDEIVEDLQIRGYQAEGLHGDLRQAQRNNVMSKFRSGTTSILVATDVAARGIDVDDVDAVFNFDIPLDEEYYVHRIGRTGRAGKSGRAFSMVGRDEKYRFREIQAYTKVRVDKGVIPSFEDIVGVRKARFIEQVQQTIKESKDLNLYEDTLTQLQHAGFSNEQIVAALVKRSMGLEKNEFADQNLALEDDRRREERGRGEGSGRFDRGRGESSGRFDRGGRGEGQSRFGGRNDGDAASRPDRGGYANRDRGDGPDRGTGRFSREGGDRPRFNRNEGDSRPDRDAKPYFDRDDKRAPREREANMTRLMVSVGRRDFIRPGDIVGAIAGEANVPGSSIGSIDIFDKFTYVDVPKDIANRVVDAMEGNTIKGHRVNVEVAK